MAQDVTSEQAFIQWRVSEFAEMGFAPLEASVLAVSKDSLGFPTSVHAVRRAIRGGCTHAQAVAIFT